jgi:16S rRNA (cytosine1402-N4)-methyltransferase
LHKTVFLEKAVEYLALRQGDIVIDATFGNGGHTRKIIECIGTTGTVITIDQDPLAVQRMHELRQTFFNICPHQANFRVLDAIVAEHKFERIDAILFDIGLSQNLIDESARGFSFKKDEPLDMRMDPSGPVRAFDVVNYHTEKEIADIIFQYGEEHRSRRIARAIINARKRQPIRTSGELAELVLQGSSWREKNARIHPATRTFQALRIFVNDELAALEEGLTKALTVLKPHGRCVVIAFHSLEDRIVKQMFRKEKDEERVTLITKKPIAVSATELIDNPRARSAKMRVVEKREQQ